MEKNFLKLQFEQDNDGTGELIAEVFSNGYSGIGSAWFNSDTLIEFAQKLRTYPILKESPIELAGGYWDQGTLKETHFSFKAYPIGSKGNIGIRIKVSTPVDYDRPENQHMTEVEISTLYSELGLFAEHVTQMVKGQTKEAILEPTP